MTENRLFDDALDALIKENDGVIPGAPIPIDQQIEKKKEEYKEYLKFEPLQERIKHALEIIQEESTKTLPESEKETILEGLAEAGAGMAAHPEAEGEALGIPNETVTMLYEFAQSKLKNGDVQAAVSLFTLLTVLDSRWYRHWYFLGICLQELKEYREAIKAYNRAIEITKEIQQESPLCDLHITACYIELIDKEKAFYHLDRAKEVINAASQSAEYEHMLTDLESRIVNI